jgi:hypothetical protein
MYQNTGNGQKMQGNQKRLQENATTRLEKLRLLTSCREASWTRLHTLDRDAAQGAVLQQARLDEGMTSSTLRSVASEGLLPLPSSLNTNWPAEGEGVSKGRINFPTINALRMRQLTGQGARFSLLPACN